MGIISLVFIVIILIYILELERKKCKCSKHWMRDFIKYVSIVMIALTFILAIIPDITKLCKNILICKLFLILYGLLSLSYIVILLIYYFHIQKKNNCPCSLDWKRYALLYPIIGLFLGIVIIIVAAVFLFNNPIKSISKFKKNIKKVSSSSKKLKRK